MEFIEACKTLISIDSSPGNGTGEACRFIKQLGEGLGFETLLVEEPQRGIDEANVVCFPNSKQEKVHLMLQTHLDTVDPGSFAHWTKTGKNPYNASIHDSIIYGLGVADTKLDFLCKLYAAQKFVGQSLPRSLAVVGTYGEEYNMNGAIRLIRHKTLLADRVLVSEPTDFQLVTAGKGLANIEITIPFCEDELLARQAHDEDEGRSTQCKMFKGKAAHSSQPLQGENAIEKMMEYLGQLPDHLLLLEVDGGTNYNTIPVQSLVEFDLIPIQKQTINQKIFSIYQKIQEMKIKFKTVQDNEFEPPLTTINIGMIRTYSDHLKIMGCVRWPPKVTEPVYMAWMDELKDFCSELDAEFRVRDHKKPFTVSRDTDFVTKTFKAIKNVHSQATLGTQPVTNEANVFHKLGVETLAFGPGQREGNSQTPFESIPIDNLNKAIRIYENIIENLCLS